jgi:hypothetical protein
VKLAHELQRLVARRRDQSRRATLRIAWSVLDTFRSPILSPMRV